MCHLVSLTMRLTPTDPHSLRSTTYCRETFPICPLPSFLRSCGLYAYGFAIQDLECNLLQSGIIFHDEPEQTSWKLLLLPPDLVHAYIGNVHDVPVHRFSISNAFSGNGS